MTYTKTKLTIAALMALIATPSNDGLAQTKNSPKKSSAQKSVTPQATSKRTTPAPQPEGDGKTALITAAEVGDLTKLNALISAGDKLNEADRKGHTALWAAAVNNHADCVKALSLAGAHAGANGITGKQVSALALDSGPIKSGTSFSLGQNGVIEGKELRSGWVNIRMEPVSISGLLPGKSVTVELKGITFWVNDGGRNWLAFTVAKGIFDGREVSVTTGIEEIGEARNRPFIVLDKEHKLTVFLEDLGTLKLEPWHKP